MTYYLPSSSESDGDRPREVVVHDASVPDEMTDLKIFWGPEICRLEYLLHLLDTGRIVDERHLLKA